MRGGLSEGVGSMRGGLNEGVLSIKGGLNEGCAQSGVATIGFTVCALKKNEKPLVLLYFRVQRLKNRWCYCVFAHQDGTWLRYNSRFLLLDFWAYITPYWLVKILLRKLILISKDQP